MLPFSTSCTSPSFKSKTSSAVLGPLYFVPSNNTLSANFGNWIIASRGLDTPSIRKHKLSLSLSLAFDLLYYSFKSFFPIFLNYITMFIYLCYSFYLLFHLSILLYLPIYVTLSNSLYYCICLSSSDNVTVPSVILSMDLCYSVLRSLFIYSSLSFYLSLSLSWVDLDSDLSIFHNRLSSSPPRRLLYEDVITYYYRPRKEVKEQVKIALKWPQRSSTRTYETVWGCMRLSEVGKDKKW